MEQTQTQAAGITLRAPGWTRLAATSVAHMTEHVYIGIVTVALPVIAASMGFSMAQAGLLVSTRYFVAGLTNLPSGLLADATRRRSTVLGFCLAFLGLGSLLMSFAPSYWPLLVFMGVSGLGTGGFHPQSIAILSSAYRERRAFALGIHDSAANLGEIIAPLTIGALLTLTDWRTTLQIWALPGLVVGISYALFFPERKHAAAEHGARAKGSFWHDVVKNRAVLAMLFVSIFRTLGQSATTVFLPLYMTIYLKLPVATMGFYISTVFFFAGISPTFSGWAADRIGRIPLIVVGSALAGLAIMAIPHLTPGIPLGIGCALVGGLLWALRPVVFAAAMEVAPPELAGTTVGFLYSGNMGLSFLAPLSAGLIADAYGLPTALTFIGVFPLLASIVPLGLLRSRMRAV
ncbi:MAG TPA: MFS transporter [Verrucomicrobiae bacterium]|jgi:MFS transporter, FSR family, fosmidomycin resistance protein|nr:MFS transporter [Verrucomicrobiae bacterium]